MRATSRRQFLLMVLGSGLAGGALARSWIQPTPPAAGRDRVAPTGRLEWRRFQRSGYALGAPVEILVLHPRQDQADAALAAAFAELALIEQLMSIYRPDSQLSRLNRDGVLDSPHPMLVEILEEALAVSAKSRGAFDPSVQPLWEAYARAARIGRVPAESELNAARRLVDWTRIELGPDRVRLGLAGMKLTLNGIAQGYAGDRVLAVLRERGIAHALLNTGEISALGRKADGQPWVAGIQHPRIPGELLGSLPVQGACLATSGDYETRFTEDGRLNHVFDPATGRSPLAYSSVSLLAPRGVRADALTKPLLILEHPESLALLASEPGTEAFWVCKDGRQLKTAGFPGPQ